MIILEFLYLLIAYFYVYIIILVTSLIFNLFYFIRFKVEKNYKDGKRAFNDMCKSAHTLDAVFDRLKTIIPKYGSDPLSGALNWFAFPIITALRTFYLYRSENDSKDCKDHCSVLKYILKNSPYGKRYKKIKIYTYLSIKPFIYMNHTIVHAYRVDNTIDVFTPYRFWKNYSIEESKFIYKEVGEMLNYGKDKIKYIKFKVLNLF